MSDAATPHSVEPRQLQTTHGQTIAYHVLEGKSPGVMFLGGFMSDMTGTKAMALEAHCRSTRRAYVRFDYSGHGSSSGTFVEGTIGEWHADALAILDQIACGPQIIVGSSMGGWQMLLAARARPERVVGLIGIAAAPDFTEDLMWAQFDEKTRIRIKADGAIQLPSDYGEEPYPITWRLIEEGRRHLLMRSEIPIRKPVHLIQGMRDEDVPWETAIRLSERLESENVTVTLVKSGDHRLSGQEDLARLTAAIETMAERAEDGLTKP